MEGCYGEEGKEGESGQKDETPQEEVEFKGYAAPRGPGESRGLLLLWTSFTSLRRFGSRGCCAGTGISSAYRIPMMSVLGSIQASLEWKEHRHEHRSDRATRSLQISYIFRRLFGSDDVLRKIELIEEPKQLAARGPSAGHVIDAGEFRHQFLLPENEDFKFGYGVHSVSFAFIWRGSIPARSRNVAIAVKAR